VKKPSLRSGKESSPCLSTVKGDGLKYLIANLLIRVRLGQKCKGLGIVAKIVEAVYEDGVLKPLEKLNLRNGQHVKIKIIEKDAIQIAREIRSRLKERLRGSDLAEILIRERERLG